MLLLFFRASVWPRRRKSFHQKLYSRLSAGVTTQTGRAGLPTRRDLNNSANSLYCIRIEGQPRLLLIVPEHACRCGYSLCRGFIVAKYASVGQDGGDEPMHARYLCYFLRSDAKTGFGRCGLSEALPVMMLQRTACTLGASVIP